MHQRTQKLSKLTVAFAALFALSLSACGGGGPDDKPGPNEPYDGEMPQGWLYTEGNKILIAGGGEFHGRGANIMDTRGCSACINQAPNPGEVKRRLDLLIDNWKANFIRLDMESYANGSYSSNYRSVLEDPQFLADLKDIIAHIKTKPGVYVMLSLWVDPSHSSQGWPTAETLPVWRKLAREFANDGHVLFGLVNEPQSNFNGALDGQVWTAMNNTVAAIREVEEELKVAPHVISVQGTRGWARDVNYYVAHPITAGGGVNIVYETHVYDPTSNFAEMFEIPKQTIPVIIGEFGPVNISGATMTMTDCSNLMQRAEAAGVPYLAWTFHMRCPPNLLVDHSGGGCGVGMTLEPTAWGNLLKNRLADPW